MPRGATACVAHASETLMRVSLLRRGVRVPRYTLIKRTKTSGGGPLDGAESDAIGGGNDTGIDDGDDGVGRRTVENRCWI